VDLFEVIFFGKTKSIFYKKHGVEKLVSAMTSSTFLLAVAPAIFGNKRYDCFNLSLVSQSSHASVDMVFAIEQRKQTKAWIDLACETYKVLQLTFLSVILYTGTGQRSWLRYSFAFSRKWGILGRSRTTRVWMLTTSSGQITLSLRVAVPSPLMFLRSTDFFGLAFATALNYHTPLNDCRNYNFGAT